MLAQQNQYYQWEKLLDLIQFGGKMLAYKQNESLIFDLKAKYLLDLIPIKLCGSHLKCLDFLKSFFITTTNASKMPAFHFINPY